MSFHDDVAQAISLYEQANQHAATRTHNMIERLGEVEALSRLMTNPDLQAGFRVLRDNDQLNKTFEAVVVKHSRLFRSDVVEAAQWRLDNPHDLL